MIELTKDNQFSVLEKIKDRKYHSCIITGYTFDFDYFELIILSQLKKVGIVNIIVLVDHNQLQNILGNLSANRVPRSDYSLYAIHNEKGGVFHPKMIYCFGENSALLSIGSGNPTSSGYGGNLEIWGTYYLDEENTEYKHLFKDAWKYISKFNNQIKGHIQKKINWIKRESYWLKSLIETENIDTSNTVFLDTQKKSIIDSVKEMNNDDIEKIILLSPFYDSRANVVKALSDHFPNSEIIILIQPEEVFFPKDFSTMNHNVFFKLIDYNEFKKYIHAKVCIFKSKNEEFCLFGSANVSKPAMGENPINEEVCILQSFKETSISTLLGFNELNKFEKFEKIKDKLIKTNPETESKEEKKLSHKVLLLNADQSKSQLTIDFKFHEEQSSFDNTIKLVFHNSHGDEVSEIEIDDSMVNISESRIIIPNNQISDENICYLLLKKSDSVISNKVLIHSIVNISSSNPNKEHRKFVSLINDLEIGNLEIYDVLKYLDPEELVNPKRTKVKTNRTSIAKKNGKDTEKVKLTSEMIEEMRESEDQQDVTLDSSEFENHSNNLWKFLDVLKNYISIQERQLREFQINTEADDEETESVEDSKGREEQQKDDNEIELTEFENIKKYINRYYIRYLRLLDKQISNNPKLNIVDITVFDFSIQLLISLANKEVKIKDEINNKILDKGLIIDIEDCKDSVENSFVIISIELIAKMIILLKNSKEELSDIAKDEELNEKTKMIYFYSTFLLCVILNIFDNSDSIKEMLKRPIVGLPINSKYPDYIKNNLSSWVWSVFMNLQTIFSSLSISTEQTEKEMSILLANTFVKDMIEIEQINNAYNLLTRIYQRDNNTVSSTRPMTPNTKIRTYYMDLELFCELSLENNSSVLYASFPGFKRKSKELDYKIQVTNNN